MSDGIVPKEERDVWGVLGRMPQEILSGPPTLREQWKKLAARADAVAKMKHSVTKVKKAKDIYHDRAALVALARGNDE